MSGRDEQKRNAAERALDLVEDGMVLGLGTGSTARYVLDGLAERLRAGRLRDVTGVPTSRATERRALELGIPIATLEEEPRVDLTLDGADEVDPSLDVIKGLGGSLLWEKIVATASDRLVIVVDESKRVERLGERAPVPVEVVPFGWATHLAYLDLLGAQATLRRRSDGEPFTTDGGHYLLDCRFEGGIRESDRLERELRQRVGLIETGLFLGMVDTVVIGDAEGAQVLSAEGR